MATTSAPGFRALTSSALGRRTLRRMSASRSASAALGAISAPCAFSASSEKRERVPAPVSTLTLAPSAVSFLTVSGETATRGSSVPSAVTAMVTMGTSDCAENFSRWEAAKASDCVSPRVFERASAIDSEALDQEIGHPRQEQNEEYDPDLGEKKELLIGARVLGVVHRRIAARQIDRHVSPPSGLLSLNFLVPQHRAAIKPIKAYKRPRTANH